MATKPLAAPPTEYNEVCTKDVSLTLLQFDADDAYTIGTALRTRLRALSEKAAVINIALANSNQLLFHAATRPGVAPDNDLWVIRKRNTVLRWGVSSWAIHNKYAGDEAAFAKKFMLGETAGQYAIHGGGFPVRVRGVEGVVAVIVVSGLAQHEDHQVIVEALEEFGPSQSLEKARMMDDL